MIIRKFWSTLKNVSEKRLKMLVYYVEKRQAPRIRLSSGSCRKPTGQSEERGIAGGQSPGPLDKEKLAR